MSKGKRMTRTVRIYDEDAKIVEIILAGKGKGSTFADVVQEALQGSFPEIAKEAKRLIAKIEKDDKERSE